MARTANWASYEVRAQQIRRFVTAFIDEHGYSPSVREICGGLGLTSASSAHHVIQRMLCEGLLTGRAGVARTLRPGHATLPAEGETL